ncbi:MAG: hypothetical protein ACI93T_004329 [Porticoccaceae bacterium]
MNTLPAKFSDVSGRSVLISEILESAVREHLNISNWLDMLPEDRSRLDEWLSHRCPVSHLDVPASWPGWSRFHSRSVICRPSVLPDIAACEGCCSNSSALSWIGHFERILVLTNAALFGVMLRFCATPT